MMQKGFISLLTFWSVLIFSVNTSNSLQYQLGRRATIPCRLSKRGARTFKWWYKKQEPTSSAVLILFKGKAGVVSYNQSLRSRIRLLENHSLIIDCLTEEDQGIYQCEVCFKNQCLEGKPKVISTKKEIENKTQKTFSIAGGGSFTHTCPGLEILNVKAENSGNYTCWTLGCHGRWEQLLTISLCVMTESGYIQTSSTSHVDTGTGITTVPLAPNGSLKYSTTPISVGSKEDNSTNVPAKGTGRELIVVYVAPAVLACLILTALLIWYLRKRPQGVYSPQPRCCCWNPRAEEEPPVVYSSIVIRKHDAVRNTALAHDDCVYSEIRG